MKIKLKKKSCKKHVVSRKDVPRDSKGLILPGYSLNPGGRPKGVPNKFTSLKQSFVDAFVEIGGKDALVDFFADGRNRSTFFRMIASMLPREVSIGSMEEIQPNNLAGLTDQELDDIVKGSKRNDSKGKSGEST